MYVGFPGTAQEQRSAKYNEPPATPSKSKDLASRAQSGEVREHAAVRQTDDYTGGSAGDSGLGDRHTWTQQPSDEQKGTFRCLGVTES